MICFFDDVLFLLAVDDENANIDIGEDGCMPRAIADCCEWYCDGDCDCDAGVDEIGEDEGEDEDGYDLVDVDTETPDNTDEEGDDDVSILDVFSFTARCGFAGLTDQQMTVLIFSVWHCYGRNWCNWFWQWCGRLLT